MTPFSRRKPVWHSIAGVLAMLVLGFFLGLELGEIIGEARVAGGLIGLLAGGGLGVLAAWLMLADTVSVFTVTDTELRISQPFRQTRSYPLTEGTFGFAWVDVLSDATPKLKVSITTADGQERAYRLTFGEKRSEACRDALSEALARARR
ncbi:hypothetical protein [Parenemella sanctibonifatiensis]|uniref:Uncharacterized protein n=1 Tax=Parenemella sanctibonifatiensis TaxID=2016505 RepID=A0A255ELA8_9ACTN|nr:hypothetical protein [Parenemella sanctibonifatiensis]OYN90242.1 hypothetical protein CGZ91_08730 [Parenemella sanctibonifatiensis]